MLPAIRSANYILFLVLVDQFVKYLVRSRFYIGETLRLTSFFNLTYLTNTGVAFSMLQGANTVFVILILLTLLVLFFWYSKNKNSLSKLTKISFLFVVSGAIGNLLDRIVHGYVIDFLDFYLGKYHWPAFNIADSYITCGGILLFLAIMKFEKAAKSNLNKA